MNRPEACSVCGCKEWTIRSTDYIVFDCEQEYFRCENMWYESKMNTCNTNLSALLTQAKEDLHYVFDAMTVWGENTSGKLAEIAKRWGIQW